LSSPSHRVETWDISASERFFTTAAVSIGSVATILTATIMNVAIPDVMGAFGIGQDKAQWVSTAFLAATTCAMLATDWAVKRFGPRATYIGAIAFFILGSIVSGRAETFDELVFGRVMQGVSGGLAQPLAMMTMFQIYPPHERGKAMGIFGLVIILAPAVGPYVGGLTVDAFGWRQIFFLPIPVAVLSLPLAAVYLKPRNKDIPAPSFDWTGFSLLALFILGLLVALTDGTADGWFSNRILFLFVTSLCSFIGFVYWELTATHPLLDIRIFANTKFSAAAFVSFVYGVAIFGSIYLVPVFVQLIQGYTATRSGLLQFPAGIAMAILIPIVGRMTDKGGEIWLTTIGLLFTAYATFLMIGADVNTSFWLFAFWMIISRIGLAVIFPPLSAASLKVLNPDQIGHASGTMNFIRTMGGAFGVNVTAIYVEKRAASYREALTATQHDGNAITLELMDRLRGVWNNFGLPEGLYDPLSHLYIGQTIIRQAEMLAFRDGFLLLTILTAVAIPAALYMKKPD